MPSSRRKRTSLSVRFLIVAFRGQHFLILQLMSILVYVYLPAHFDSPLITSAALFLDNTYWSWCGSLVFPTVVYGYLRLRSCGNVDHLTFPPRNRTFEAVHHTLLSLDSWHHCYRNGRLSFHHASRPTRRHQLQCMDGVFGLVCHLVFRAW